MRRLAPLVAAALALALPSVAAGSIKIGVSPRAAALKVTSTGAAQVSWRTATGWRTVVIRRNGSVRYGARLLGRDISVPVEGVAIPFAWTVRKANGRLWALQAWRRLKGWPVELRFARWIGEPTLLTVHAVCCKWGSENVRGRATFHGRAIYGSRATPTGVPLDKYARNVYLDTFRRGRWQRMMGILTHRTGTFSLWIRPYWRGRMYRGSIVGPNWGWTLAPDARATTRSSLL